MTYDILYMIYDICLDLRVVAHKRRDGQVVASLIKCMTYVISYISYNHNN